MTDVLTEEPTRLWRRPFLDACASIGFLDMTRCAVAAPVDFVRH